MRRTARGTLTLTLGLTLALAGCGDEEPRGSTDADGTAAVETPDGAEDSQEPADTGEETGQAEDPAASDDQDPADSDPSGDGADEAEQGDPGGDAGDGAEGGAGTAPGDPGTEIVTVPMFGAEGYPTADWDIEDRSAEPAFGCWAPSGATLEADSFHCGASADFGVACLPNPLAEDEVICAYDPVAQTGFRHKVSDFTDGEPHGPEPLTVELEDGSIWTVRSGGAGPSNEYDEELVAYYYCSSGCDESDVLWGVPDSTAFDTSGEAWTVTRATAEEEPRTENVARAWFIGP